MEKYIYINYASQDDEMAKKLAAEIEASGISAYYGEASKRRVSESACVLNCATKHSRDSKSYRKVAEYAQKHMIDSVSIHFDENCLASDIEMQLDLLHMLFKYQCRHTFVESAKVEKAENKETSEHAEETIESVEKPITVNVSQPVADQQKNDEYVTEKSSVAEPQIDSDKKAEAANDKKTEAATSTYVAEKFPESEAVIDGDQLMIAEDEAKTQTALESYAEKSQKEKHPSAKDKKHDKAEKVVVGKFNSVPTTKEALFVEGMKLLKGDGVDVNIAQGFDYLMQAATQGYVEAQYQLSMCYDSGLGAKRSITEAAKWCQMAAYGGHAQAQSEIGYCYESGRGVIRNVKEAVRWYEMASSQGNVDAKNNLAFCYQKGRGVQKDVAKAIQIYTEAAELGHASSQYNLGYCYWYGEGVEVDKEKAIKYFEQSAANGNAKAGQMLKILNQRSFVRS